MAAPIFDPEAEARAKLLQAMTQDPQSMGGDMVYMPGKAGSEGAMPKGTPRVAYKDAAPTPTMRANAAPKTSDIAALKAQVDANHNANPSFEDEINNAVFWTNQNDAEKYAPNEQMGQIPMPLLQQLFPNINVAPREGEQEIMPGQWGKVMLAPHSMKIDKLSPTARARFEQMRQDLYNQKGRAVLLAQPPQFGHPSK